MKVFTVTEFWRDLDGNSGAAFRGVFSSSVVAFASIEQEVEASPGVTVTRETDRVEIMGGDYMGRLFIVEEFEIDSGNYHP
jgi:hypothetical protein